MVNEKDDNNSPQWEELNEEKKQTNLEPGEVKSIQFDDNLERENRHVGGLFEYFKSSLYSVAVEAHTISKAIFKMLQLRQQIVKAGEILELEDENFWLQPEASASTSRASSSKYDSRDPSNSVTKVSMSTASQAVSKTTTVANQALSVAKGVNKFFDNTANAFTAYSQSGGRALSQFLGFSSSDRQQKNNMEVSEDLIDACYEAFKETFKELVSDESNPEELRAFALTVLSVLLGIEISNGLHAWIGGKEQTLADQLKQSIAWHFSSIMKKAQAQSGKQLIKLQVKSSMSMMFSGGLQFINAGDEANQLVNNLAKGEVIVGYNYNHIRDASWVMSLVNLGINTLQPVYELKDILTSFQKTANFIQEARVLNSKEHDLLTQVAAILSLSNDSLDGTKKQLLKLIAGYNMSVQFAVDYNQLQSIKSNLQNSQLGSMALTYLPTDETLNDLVPDWFTEWLNAPGVDLQLSQRFEGFQTALSEQKAKLENRRLNPHEQELVRAITGIVCQTITPDVADQLTAFSIFACNAAAKYGTSIATGPTSWLASIVGGGATVAQGVGIVYAPDIIKGLLGSTQSQQQISNLVLQMNQTGTALVKALPSFFATPPEFSESKTIANPRTCTK